MTFETGLSFSKLIRTICKVQGQNLGIIILWLNCLLVPKGSAYVALPRIRQLKDLYFISKTESNGFPVSLKSSFVLSSLFPYFPKFLKNQLSFRTKKENP